LPSRTYPTIVTAGTLVTVSKEKSSIFEKKTATKTGEEEEEGEEQEAECHF
jgi:hypothetical protein